MLLIHRCDVIQPIKVRDRLQIGFLFDQLLGAAMKQSNVRIDTRDNLAVKLQHKAQHAMRRRMLRSEIDSEIAHPWLFGHHAPAFGGAGTAAAAFSSPGSG